MNKIKISQDLLAYKVVFTILFFVLFIFLIADKPYFHFQHLFSFFVAVPLYFYNKMYNVWYDENNIYFFEKGEEISVPLEDLIKISELYFKINRVTVLYISFPDKEGNLKKIRFLPNWDTFSKLKTILSDVKYKTEVRVTETKFW